MFTSTRCHKKGKVFKNALWQNVHKEKAQVLFDRKITVKHNDSLSNTRYLHGFQYYDNVLQFFHTPEGYVKNTPTDNGDPSFDYVYQYKDHLGNVRVNYAQNPQTGALEILEENHYYPFGLQHTNYNSDLAGIKRDEQSNEKSLAQDTKPTNPFDNPGYNYKFGGKELQSEFGVEMYDFGARNYDPAIGRWMNIDPLAEQMRRHSPYNYAFNSPIFFIDPDGMKPLDIIYYNLKGKEVNRIKQEGADIKKLVLTTSNRGKVVNDMINKGELVGVPSNAVIDKMDEAYNITESTGNEAGFLVNTEGTPSKIVEGKSGTIGKSEWDDAQQDLASKTSYDVHTHPNTKDENGKITKYGSSSPSTGKGGDTENLAGNNEPSMVLGYRQTQETVSTGAGAGQSETRMAYPKTIGIYNESGRINTEEVDYNQFKNAVKTINNEN